jgi:hypothetical protein
MAGPDVKLINSRIPKLVDAGSKCRFRTVDGPTA